LFWVGLATGTAAKGKLFNSELCVRISHKLPNIFSLLEPQLHRQALERAGHRLALYFGNTKQNHMIN